MVLRFSLFLSPGKGDGFPQKIARAPGEKADRKKHIAPVMIPKNLRKLLDKLGKRDMMIPQTIKQSLNR